MSFYRVTSCPPRNAYVLSGSWAYSLQGVVVSESHYLLFFYFFTCFPTTIVYGENSMVAGKQEKGLLGKKMKGWGKWKKGENGFPPSNFFPKSSVFIFFPQQPVFPLMDHGENGFPHSWFSILINDNHHLQCVSYLYKPCRLVKNSLKWCKNSSFKVENFKISWGATPTGACWEKNDFLDRGGGWLKCTIHTPALLRIGTIINTKSHTLFEGVKPYACPVCGCRFHLVHNMKRHIQTHEEQGDIEHGTADGLVKAAEATASSPRPSTQVRCKKTCPFFSMM